MKPYLPILALLFFVPVSEAATNGDPSRPGREWSGAGSIRAGRYDEAIRHLRADSSYLDTGYHYFKLGLCSYRLEDQGTALTFLRLAARHSPGLAPVAYELIGDMEQWRGNTDAGITAYRSALESVTRGWLRRRLQDKISSLVIDNRLDTAQLPWIWPWFKRGIGKPRRDRQTHLDSLICAGDWTRVDSCLRGYMDTLGNEDLCPVLGTLFASSPPDTALGTDLIYRISKAAYGCQNWDIAQTWVERAAARTDFADVVSRDDHLMHRASICAKQARYRDALTWLFRFEKQFGSTTPSVLAMARAYRNLDKKDSADRAYRRYADRFPQDQKTPDILWYLAWQSEDGRQTATAAGYYRTIIRRFPRNPKAEESLFRLGLLFYKDGQHDSARGAWTTLQKRFPQSSLTPAAAYWQAKSMLSQMRLDSAQIVLRTVIATDPCNYYAFRSREMLALTGDTLDSQFGDTRYDGAKARAWLDSVSPLPRRPLSTADSAKFLIGTSLAVLGLIPEARAYLDELESDRPNNLLLQYDLASLYAQCDAPAPSYRVARRLAWRIPASCRMNTPLAAYHLLYPQFYAEVIGREAVRNTLDPALIHAIIRQESIFDAAIVSPAGAIGLMQIMPQTGRAIAGSLHEPYAADSLYNPVTNIRFGAFYIRQLLDQFDGNITLAIASYNGGPHNASLWHSLNRDDSFDVFVEDIAFAETRGYVKKVLANYWTYQQLQKIPGYVSGKVIYQGP